MRNAPGEIRTGRRILFAQARKETLVTYRIGVSACQKGKDADFRLMNSAPALPVTQLLGAWGDGDQSALHRLIPFVYDELRRRARQYMARERPGNSLQPTAVVNELYLRLAAAGGVRCEDRTHFFAMAAQIMRRILVDAARTRACAKRGGQARKISLEEGMVGDRGSAAELVALDDALATLGRKDARKAKVVELRFFAGLSLKEIAEALQVSEDTVGRDWNFAKAWLAREVR
jgi:RNA polymerase sigma-70 factor (ECF subfamily)